MGLWRDEVAVLFVRQVTAQALPYVKPALKCPACCIIVITVTKSQAAQIKPITANHANQLYQHGTLALRDESNHRLDLFASAVEGMVKRLEHVPATIQLNQDVQAMLL